MLIKFTESGYSKFTINNFTKLVNLQMHGAAIEYGATIENHPSQEFSELVVNPNSHPISHPSIASIG